RRAQAGEPRARARDGTTPVPAGEATRDRGADAPAPHPGPRRRRRGHPRFQADHSVPRVEVRQGGPGGEGEGEGGAEEGPAAPPIQCEAVETPQEAVQLTDKAAVKIKDLLAADESAGEQALRVAVRGGGCSGF